MNGRTIRLTHGGDALRYRRLVNIVTRKLLTIGWEVITGVPKHHADSLLTVTGKNRWLGIGRQFVQMKDGVFCASMADVFEPRSELNQLRERLWQLIEETPMLDWLLLTKRPGSIAELAPWTDHWPSNVWLGVTVESNKWYARIDRLLRYLAKIKFLSCEPLFSELHLSDYLPTLDWVIAGGESGTGARPTDPKWVRSLRDQCQVADVAFHFKQWGHWVPGDGDTLVALGKKRAGRLLDQRTWDAVPGYV